MPADRDRRGGKYPNRPSEGLALPEFIDSAGVNSRETGVGQGQQLPEARRKTTGLGRVVEKALENPTLVIAGLAAVPLLFLAWGATRRWRRKPQPEHDEEFE